jgi:hypothetical protein
MSAMSKPVIATILFVATLSLAGCSYVDRLTGSTDNTVLPGSREDAIPGKTQFPEKSDTATIEQPGKTAQTATTATVTPPKPLCKAGDPKCKTASDGTFSDPQ